VADDAVCCELLSRFNFPDNQGKYREFPQSGDVLPASAREKGLVFLAFCSKFPSQANREFSTWNSELHLAYQGNFFRVTKALGKEEKPGRHPCLEPKNRFCARPHDEQKPG
jgi:hypothetical protein